MLTRQTIARRVQQLEQAHQDRQPREPLPPPVWISAGLPDQRYKRSELRPDELPPPIWLIDDE